MPIANCIVTPDSVEGRSDLIEHWASESAQSPEHMTINITISNRQLGNKYRVMASLFPPSMWSSENVSILQIGLAKALAKHFDLALSEVHVITNVVNSGSVVESGQEIKW